MADIHAWREREREEVLSDLIGIKSQYPIMCKENLHMHECELIGALTSQSLWTNKSDIYRNASFSAF